MASGVRIGGRRGCCTLGAVMQQPVTAEPAEDAVAGAAPKVQELEAELVVARHETVAEGVVVVTLEDPAGGALPRWTPGAHIDLMLGSSLVRQYSLCSSPSDPAAWRVGVLRDPQSRGGSQFVHDELRAGSAVRVRGPRNHFPLVKTERYQFIAGGIGITPMLAMIEAAEAAGAEWHLLYGGRERASMAFTEELSAHGERVTLWPQDERGMLDLPSVLGTPREDTSVYCCGPGGLLDAVEAACAPWPAGALHIERFSAKPGPAPAEGALETFEVVCQRSGITVTVSGEQSVLEALEDAQVNVLGSCYEGVCGSCEAEVLEGIPDHRDSVLTDDERAANDVMMCCVSRSLSERLVLDL
jgi:ferredoxin-NADP reductase